MTYPLHKDWFPYFIVVPQYQVCQLCVCIQYCTQKTVFNLVPCITFGMPYMELAVPSGFLLQSWLHWWQEPIMTGPPGEARQTWRCLLISLPKSILQTIGLFLPLRHSQLTSQGLILIDSLLHLTWDIISSREDFSTALPPATHYNSNI